MTLVLTSTKLGGLNFKDPISGLYLHSQYDPIKEADRMISAIHVKETVLVCIGLGAGYLLESLLKVIQSLKLRSIYIWEPETSLEENLDLKKK